MMKIPDLRRGIVRTLSLAAAAILVLAAVPDQRAEALSLINPGAAPAAKHASDGLTTEVHGGHGGGGAAFHAGGFRSGGAVFRGGGFRHGGFRFGHRRRFGGPFYYGPSYYYPYRHCRIVWTYYGPHRICYFHRWHHRRFW